jgi:hypothetical protein
MSTPFEGAVNSGKVSAQAQVAADDTGTSTERDGAADAEVERYRLAG